MAEFKIDYKLIGPQLYEDDGRKLMRDSSRGSVTVTADTYEEAKKKSKNIIKNSKSYTNFQDRFQTDAPKPRISFLKNLKAAGGSGSQKYEGVKEIFPKPNIQIDRLKKNKGGRIDKALPGGNKYI